MLQSVLIDNYVGGSRVVKWLVPSYEWTGGASLGTEHTQTPHFGQCLNAVKERWITLEFTNTTPGNLTMPQGLLSIRNHLCWGRDTSETSGIRMSTGRCWSIQGFAICHNPCHCFGGWGSVYMECCIYSINNSDQSANLIGVCSNWFTYLCGCYYFG